MVRRYFPVDVGWLGRDGIYILTYCIDGCKEGVMDGFTSPSSSPPPSSIVSSSSIFIAPPLLKCIDGRRTAFLLPSFLRSLDYCIYTTDYHKDDSGKSHVMMILSSYTWMYDR